MILNKAQSIFEQCAQNSPATALAAVATRGSVTREMRVVRVMSLAERAESYPSSWQNRLVEPAVGQAARMAMEV